MLLAGLLSDISTYMSADVMSTWVSTDAGGVATRWILLAQTEPKHFVAIAGILVLIWAVFRFGSKKRRRASSGEAAPDQPVAVADPKAVHRAGEDLSEVLVQLQEVSREVEARLDTRIRYARRLLDEADAATERLQGMLDAVQGQAAPGPATAVSTAAQAAAAYQSPSSPPAVSAAGAGVESADDSASSAESNDESVATVPPVGVRPEVARISELSAQGKEAAEIARELKVPMGEVELVLGLQRQANRENSA